MGLFFATWPGKLPLINIDAIHFLFSTPSAYPSHSPAALDELSEEFTALLTDVYSNKDILPTNLVIIPGKKVWTLHVDALILSEDGNILDILFLATHAALYNCQIP